MDVGSAVLSALFVMLIVFVVLVVLWVMLRFFSTIILSFEKRSSRRAEDAGNGGK
jgi:Na+-transporting methylmalonyl-CoA/oxaloacetate decarboxylase gamma subunit